MSEIEFRRDADTYAWGVVNTMGSHKWAFYPDEEYKETEQTSVDVYLEWSLSDTLQLNVDVNSLVSGTLSYDREVYTEVREGSLDYRYLGIERYKPSVSLSISGQF